MVGLEANLMIAQSLLTNDRTSWQNFTTLFTGEKWKWRIALSAAGYQIVLLFVKQKLRVFFFQGVTNGNDNGNIKQLS